MAPSCCQPASSCFPNQQQVSDASESTKSKNLVEVVNAAYSTKAREGVDPTYANKVAAAFGYTSEQLNAVPDSAHMGLSCGNPVATATIKEGETVVDLGSGGGIDVFLAAQKVGPTGQVIGLDISSDMIALARNNAAKKSLKPPHVSFVQASLVDPLPIESESVDCILSNCVINLLPLEGKGKLVKEMHRILRKGGRVVLDDIIAKKPLPSHIKESVIAYVGCLAGAVTEDEYKTFLADACFNDVQIVDNKHDLNVYLQTDNKNAASSTACCTPAPAGMNTLPPDYNANEWASSCKIYAVKGKDSMGDPSVAVPSKPALLRWWDAYPNKGAPGLKSRTPVKATLVPHLTAKEVAKLVRDSDGNGLNLAVIDVRRADHGGGHIRGSYNFHAQTFYDDLPSFYEKFKDKGKVIFYCQSSNGRGPRCAGWYQDYLDEQDGKNHSSKAYILQGGIKQFIKEFDGNEDLIDQD